MKKFLCTILCAILLMGLLPMEAKALTDFSITVNTTQAYIGDTLEWEIYNVNESVGPLEYSFNIWFYGDYGIVYISDGWHTYSTYTFKPTGMGRYKIEAWVKDANNDLKKLGPETVVGLRRPKITSVTAINGTSLKITWDKVPGATGYTWLRSTSKSGYLSAVQETTATTFTDKNCNAGTPYYYRVIATIGPFSSNISSTVAGVPLNKSTVTAVTSPSAKRLKVSWAKVPSATGYIVYRSLSAGGTYVKVQTTTALTFTNTGLTSGKTYYYKVKPYKQFSTTNFYGPLSGYKSRKVK